MPATLLLLPVVVWGFQHDPSSPAVGHFPGRRLAAAGEERRLQSVPLYGSMNDYAYYFADVLVGTPPQRQSLILDSGSSLLGFPCTSCGRYCGRHLDPPFDISKSTTAEHYTCQDRRCVSQASCSAGQMDSCLYSQRYSEGSSIEGFFFSDQIALGDVEDGNAFVTYDYIGCHSKETVLFTTQQANGILGVSFPKGGRQPTVMDILLGSRTVNAKVFSLCGSEDGGLLAVGGYNESYHRPSYSSSSPLQGLSWLSNFLRGAAQRSSASALARAGGGMTNEKNKDIVWIRIQSDSAYAISISRLSIEGRTIANSGFSEVLVDSGTTYSYFPPDVYHAIEQELIDLCTRNNQLPKDQQAGQCVRGKADIICFNFPHDDTPVLDYIRRVPSFSVELGNGGVVEWEAESWLFRKTERVWCSAIENNRRRQSILGMSFMKMKNVIFDRDNSYIGFVSANCPSHLVENRPPPPQANETITPTASITSDEKNKPRFDGLTNRDIWLGQTGSQNDTIPMMRPLSTDIYNDKALWKWASHSALPYFNSIDEPAVIPDTMDHTAASWAIGGGVGLAVVGGLVSLVMKSTSREADQGFSAAEMYDSNDHARFPVFDELERGDDWLG